MRLSEAVWAMSIAQDDWPKCKECKEPFQFSHDEPFAVCNCGTTEWGNPRPDLVNATMRLLSLLEDPEAQDAIGDDFDCSERNETGHHGND